MAERTYAGLTCSEVADLAPAFVLGALEPGESDAVRRHLAECPERHPEMAELHSVVPALFSAVEPVAPSPALKDRILAAAASEPAVEVGRSPRSAPAGRDSRPREEGGRPSRWMTIFRRPIWAPVALAAALGVAVLGYSYADLRRDNEALAAYRQGVVQLIEEATAPGAQLAVLGPPEGTGPSGVAAVAANGTVALVMRDLTPTTGTQVYEAWVIAGQAAPVPIGELTVGEAGFGTLRTEQQQVGEGVVVALSLEPGPDSTTPTTVVAVGQARAAQGG